MKFNKPKYATYSRSEGRQMKYVSRQAVFSIEYVYVCRVQSIGAINKQKIDVCILCQF